MMDLNKFWPAFLTFCIFFIVIIKYKRIYLNITNDNEYNSLKTFKYSVYIGGGLSLVSSTLMMYVSMTDIHNEIISEIGFDSLILSAITMAYGMNYITSEKRFPNGNINIITSIRRSIKWIIMITILSIVGGLINAFW